MAARRGGEESGEKGGRRIRQRRECVPERNTGPLWDLTLRELALPWVNFMTDDLVRGKVLAWGRGAGCRKAAARDALESLASSKL